MRISNAMFLPHVQFTSITLEEKEKVRAQEVLNALQEETNDIEIRKLKTDLLDIFKPHIQKEVSLKTMRFHDRKNFAQRIYLRLFEFQKILKTNSPNALERLIADLESVKPDRNEDLLPGAGFKERLLGDNNPKMDSKTFKHTYEEAISNESHAEVVSFKSPEEIDEIKREINKTIQKDELSAKEQLLLQRRAKGIFFKDIAEEIGISTSRTNQACKTAIAKIQQAEGILPEDIKSLANDFKTEFKLEEPIEKLEKIIINYIYLRTYDIKDIRANVNDITQKLNISEPQFLKCAMQQPPLFTMRSCTLMENVEKSAKIMQTTNENFIKTALKSPQILVTKPETLAQKVNELSLAFDAPKSAVIKAFLHIPSFFTQDTQRLIKNIEIISKEFGLDPKDYKKAALVQPSICILKPETIFANVQAIAKELDIDVKQLAKLYLRQPQLFIQSPETIKSNLEGYQKYLKIPKETLKELVLKSTAFLYQRPDTNIKHIEQSAKYMEISTEEFIKKGMKNPVMFSMNPETIKRRIDIVDFFKLIKGKPSDRKVYTSEAEPKQFARILKQMIRINNKVILPEKNITENVTKYIAENADKIFEFKLPEHYLAEDFIKFVDDLSIKTTGRKIFKFII